MRYVQYTLYKFFKVVVALSNLYTDVKSDHS